MFSVELKRGFSRLSFKIAILIGIIFCTLSIVQVRGGNNDLQEYIKAYITTPFDNFIFFKLNPISNILILILPIISSLSYSDSYLEDVNSGFIKFIYTRQNKQKYLLSKYFANFIVSGISFAIPILLNFIALMILVPNVQPNPILGQPTIMYGGLFPQLFYKHPILYIMMWIIIYFLYAGAFASVGLSLGIFIKNKFVVLILPFIFCNVASVLFELCDKSKYAPFQFLYLSNEQNFFIILFEFLIIFVITVVLFSCGGYKNETF